MKAQVLYAAHDDGIELPVIDITNPAFAMTVTDAEVMAMARQYVSELAQQRAIAPEVEAALKQSPLGRAIQEAAGSYLPSLTTYVLKLGPDNLGAAESSPIDRHIVASFGGLSMRMRLEDMARLLAGGLAKSAASEPRRPLCMVNIAGGPAADSWNALILLRAEKPELLDGREVVIAVLDLDEKGPAFGARALAVLRKADAPLSGLDIRMRHLEGNWPRPAKEPVAGKAQRAASPRIGRPRTLPPPGGEWIDQPVDTAPGDQQQCADSAADRPGSERVDLWPGGQPRLLSLS